MRKLLLLLCLFLFIGVDAVFAQGVIIKAGSYDAFEIFNGSLWAWGFNNYGALGTGNKNDYISPTRVGSFSDWVDIYPGDIHTVGKRSDGTLWVWGTSYNAGELGLGNSLQTELSPVLLNNDHDWNKVAVGVHHTLAIKNDNSLWSWGSNDGGQLGYETLIDNTNKNTFLPVKVDNSEWKAVSGGYHFSVGIKTDGTLWEWGNNSDFVSNPNQGTNVINSVIPKQVGSASDWVFVAAGYYHALAIKADGTLWAWGDNRFGQLGIGNSTTSIAEPVRVGEASNWLSVSGAREHSIGVKADGTLWSWGSNASGQLGVGQTINIYQLSPIQIGSETNWSTNISANGGSSYARKKDNTVWAWGSNEYGQLGIGNTQNQFTPQQVQLPQNAPLPVTLLNFSATKKGNGNLLNWLTATELNTSRFEVERSDNGINFTRIGTVAAAGNSSAQIRYEYLDHLSSSNKTFYRLKIIDKDNRYNYSKIVVSNGSNKESQFQLYPNPAHNEVHIYVSNVSGTNSLKMQLVDVAGKVVRMENWKVTNNEIFTEVDVTNLQKGIYFIKLQEINKVLRFVKD